MNPDPVAGAAAEPRVKPVAEVCGAVPRPNVEVGAPKEKPPPPAVLFAAVPKLKELVAAAGVAV